MTPTTARAFWVALLENAARLVAEADALFPSPRAQSLVVIAQEEVGKAVWVYKAFWSAWGDGDETPSEVPELRQKGLLHAAKLAAANGYLTALVEYPGSPEPVEIELVEAHDPEWLAAHLAGIAQEDNEAKKKGFYVDAQADGSFTVPHEIERPNLSTQIWWTADMIKWFLWEDRLWTSLSDKAFPSTEGVEALLATILERGPAE